MHSSNPGNTSFQESNNPLKGGYLEGPLHEAAHSPFVIGALVEEDCPSEAALAPPGVDTPSIGLGDPSHQGG